MIYSLLVSICVFTASSIAFLRGQNCVFLVHMLVILTQIRVHLWLLRGDVLRACNNRVVTLICGLVRCLETVFQSGSSKVFGGHCVMNVYISAESFTGYLR